MNYQSLSNFEAEEVYSNLNGVAENAITTDYRPALIEAVPSHIADPGLALDEPYHEPITLTFLSLANRHPLLPAIYQGERHWTYGNLAEQALKLAAILVEQGLQPGQVVAVTGQRSFGLITSMLATLLSGGVLLTLDRNLPADRQRLMLKEAGTKHLLLVGNPSAQQDWLSTSSDLSISRIKQDTVGLLSKTGLPVTGTILPELAPQDPAYIFFTSGTTGMPKGVLGSHRGLSHFLNWQSKQFEVGFQDRASQLTALSFDVVLRDIFLALTSGASLHLLEKEGTLEAAEILTWLEREKITIIHTVPALAQYWLSNVPTGVNLASLRLVFFAGEPLTDTLVNRWRKAFPGRGEIINLYGPTETTLAKFFYVVPEQPMTGIQPVGRPLPQTQALLLRPDGSLCGLEELGEIVIRTPFRTLGYINSRPKDQMRFINNPFSQNEHDLLYRSGDLGRYNQTGLLEIAGRVDDQVKIRGIRIEPAEVMAVLAGHSQVKACFVAAHKDEHGSYYLAAYVVSSGSNKLSRSELLDFLNSQVPSAMIPEVFIFLPELPLTPNGKVDRKALPAPDKYNVEKSRPYLAPRNLQEQQIAEIWEDVLGLKPVGIQDRFLELGGNSLEALTILARLENLYKVKLSYNFLLESPTVEMSALNLLQQANVQSSTPLIAIQPNGSKRPVFFVHNAEGKVLAYSYLAEALGQDQPFYGFQAVGAEGEAFPQLDFKEMAATYITAMRSIQPEGPYLLGGHSMGGILAFEMAQQLIRQGQTVEVLALVDANSPLTTEPIISRIKLKYLALNRLLFDFIDFLRLLEPEHPQAATWRKARKSPDIICDPAYLWSLDAAKRLVYVLEMARKVDNIINEVKETRWPDLGNINRSNSFFDRDKKVPRLKGKYKFILNRLRVFTWELGIGRLLTRLVIQQQLDYILEITQQVERQHRKDLNLLPFLPFLQISIAYKANYKYRPQLYPGSAVFFLSRELMDEVRSRPVDPQSWKTFIAGALKVVKVPGNHRTMLDKPHVQSLAEQLAAYIESASNDFNNK